MICQIKNGDFDIFDKLYILYIKNKSTWIIRNNKSMTIRKNILKKMHVNLKPV